MNIVEESKSSLNIIQPQQHSDESCPNMEQIKKLKGEIKRLRQELIMKGTRKKDEEEYLTEDSELDEEEKAAIRMLP